MSFDLIERLKVSHLDWCEKNAPGCDPAAIVSVMAEAAAELTRLRAKVEAADKLAEAVEGQENREMCGCDGHRCRDCIRRDDALNAALSAYDGEKG